MKPRHLPLVLALSACLLGVAGLAAAGPHGPLGFFAHGHAAAVGKLIRNLDLDDTQTERLDAVHEAIAGHFHGRIAVHRNHARALLERLDQGPLHPEEARHVVDHELERVRAELYLLTDEVVGLINSLDDRQRQVLAEHLEEAARAAETHQEPGS